MRRQPCIVRASMLALIVGVHRMPAQVAPSQLRTRWAADVTPQHVLPEYPRPQLVRSAWTNLNGTWDYAITGRNAPTPTRWDGRILVPFAVQSQLSSVRRAVSDSQQLWYHRTFHVSTRPAGRRWLLHFGAVDWETSVFVNGVKVGDHRGGYDPFTFDVTSALRGSGDQDLVVRVWDPTNHGPEPRGKQVLAPRSIWYTAVTGIWQTVWLEPVLPAHIAGIVAVPDIDSGTVTLQVTADGAPTATRVRATVTVADQIVATGSAPLGQPLTLHIARPHLWSPADPFLYDLRVALSAGDTVQSYFGMRKIAVTRDSAGIARLFLNNRPLFEFGMLDQGWWPDGLYTAPTDAALQFDLRTMKRLGFNMVRKHVKVEPERWYYHADRLGMLVWQDMPSGDNNTAEGKAEFETELHRVVAALQDHPSIVMWVPFNEGWGQHDTERYVAWLKAYDPSRLVDNASGWTDKHVGDVSDVHEYPGPGMPPLEANRAAVLGEFGGLGLPVAGHTWLDRNNWGYRSFTSTESLGTAYRDLLGQLRWDIADGLSAAVYTQTTDVEVEVNGLMTYDRAMVKLPPSAIAAAASLFGAPPKARTVFPTSQATGQSWRYTTVAPASDWFATRFGDSHWSQGLGGFGTDSTPGAVVRTRWAAADIWLRRTFSLPSLRLIRPQWHIHHDEDADIYLNGELAATLSGYTAGYIRVPLDAHAISLLKTGTNTLAIHVHQTTGGQYIDVGLEEVVQPGEATMPDEATITRMPFGIAPSGDSVELFTLTNPHGMEVRVMTYGGIIESLRVPDRTGTFDDVVLGYDSLTGYVRNSPYFGAIVGRYGNRIAKGRFSLDGKTYQLATNNGPNALHGGLVGFDKVVWHAAPFKHDSSVGVVLTHVSPAGDQGYPGKLDVRVTYTLTSANELSIDYHATTDQATPINLTQHSYFNLAGAGKGDILGHLMLLNADHYTPVDSTLIPTGVLAPVTGTPFDFRTPTAIGARIAQPDAQLKNAGGYDHNFVLTRADSGLSLAARVVEPTTGRVLTVSTTEPGVQFYTGNFLDGTITGKNGRVYQHRYGFALETQHFPDSPNHANFPSTILRPGTEYNSRTVFAFNVQK
ncbi:MAG: galactose-1-epimerase [Gemmatimonadales bacterium]